MSRMTESEMMTSVRRVAQDLGYQVNQEPSAGWWRSARRGHLTPVNFGRALRPDLLVRHGDRSAVVEIKNRGVLFGGVEQVIQYAEIFKAAGVLCMPDDAYSDIPASVAGYADDEHVFLCPISQIGEVLTDILGRTEDVALQEVDA